MLSRAVSRSLPRATSRLAQSTTTRTLLQPTLRASLRQSTLRPQAIWQAGFSTSLKHFDAVSQELSAKLASEISLEGENTTAQTDSDAGAERFLEENSQWTLESPDGEQNVVLRREFDDEIITVAFSIVDFNTSVLPMDGEEGDEAFMDEEDEIRDQSGGANTKGAINQGGTKNDNFKVAPEDSIAPADREELIDEDYDDDGQQAYPANVNVLIQRAGKGALRINLVTDNGRFTIHGVTHLPETTPASSVADLLRNTPDHIYTGPPFQQLDEEVQGLFEQYLDARGINTALALFIPDYIDVKEQKEYVGWLGRVKEFVE
ncbi:mitochondrial glyco protein [Neohortaea acidophila]|uniref:Mitochondrial glyco protein n=1 Tax=Neohortaea acidophila TaxID=245834 RepID=A0A6A6PP98_9PEZI|nr:mitochondrial glyco protein [Neohortaea acidophila]KAF2481454.1 mitochondrial glyco protein [Neohortaea acidophila]